MFPGTGVEDKNVPGDVYVVTYYVAQQRKFKAKSMAEASARAQALCSRNFGTLLKSVIREGTDLAQPCAECARLEGELRVKKQRQAKPMWSVPQKPEDK